MDKWNITISWFICSSRGRLECWQLTWMADGSQTQRAEVYTRSHSEARTRQMIHRNLVHSWHCTISGIAMCREDVYSVLPIWRFDKRRFGDSQFFWNCPPPPHSTCRGSDEPFRTVTCPAWQEWPGVQMRKKLQTHLSNETDLMKLDIFILRSILKLACWKLKFQRFSCLKHDNNLLHVITTYHGFAGK